MTNGARALPTTQAAEEEQRARRVLLAIEAEVARCRAALDNGQRATCTQADFARLAADFRRAAWAALEAAGEAKVAE